MDTLQLRQIRIDGGTQTRAAISNDVVTEYAEAMRDGDAFPPVVVVFDGESYWLADGFHRVEAARQAGLNQIAADVHQGTRRDAVLASVGANARHGFRRTNQDKRRAVQTLLADEEWAQWSDREIARRAGVSAPFVARMRAESGENAGATINIYSQPKRRGADGRTINVASIGRPANAGQLAQSGGGPIGVGDTIKTISGTIGMVRRVFDDHVLAEFDRAGDLVEEEWSLNHLSILYKAEAEATFNYDDDDDDMLGAPALDSSPALPHDFNVDDQPDQPADEDDAGDPLDRDLYNLDLTPASFKPGESLMMQDGRIGVVVPVNDAARLLKKGASVTVETPQEAPAAEPFDLPEMISDMPPLPWKMNGPSHIVSHMQTVARVYDGKLGQMIVEAMNERYAAFAGQDNDDLKVGEQVYYLSMSGWRLATVTGLSAKRVQIKLPDKAKPSYVELRSLDRRPFGLPLLPGPAPRKRRWES